MRKILVLILVTLLMLSACDAGYKRDSAGASEFYNAMSVIHTCVPHWGGMDLRLDRIELLETDDYGRTLFRYMFALTGSEAFLIVQKTEGSFVSYCEDYCYLYAQEKDTINKNNIDWLKEQNSWNAPTTARKIVSLDFSAVSPDHVGIENHLNVRQIILQYLNETYPDIEWENTKINLNCLENYPGLGQIIFITDASNYIDTQYLVLYDQSAENPVIALKTVQDEADLRETIISFKEEYCLKTTITK